MKYFVITTLCILQLAVGPLNAFHYGPDPTEAAPIELDGQ